ncbi:ABC transporter permease [Ilumatobacter sp.]|uniref:ABC transporter permease n=1 Tax=Ilumatobacter sp. TaxID=1967498 RepID=UPI003B52447D
MSDAPSPVRRGWSISPVAAARDVETEWANYRRTWRASLMSAFLAPLLYLGAIGYGLGSLVEAGESTLGADVSYVGFLAPGLIAATALQVGAQEGIFGTMGRIRWQRTWHVAVSTPVMPGDLAVGHLAWCAVRGAIAAAIYALVTVGLGVLDPLPALAAIAPGVLCAIALAAPLQAWMVVAENEHSMNAAQRFLVVPMFLFSGVFFPISQLPGWMQPIAQLTPLWHGVELARRIAIGSSTSSWPAIAHVAFLVALTAVGVVVGVRNFTRRLAR